METANVFVVLPNVSVDRPGSFVALERSSSVFGEYESMYLRVFSAL